MTWLDIERIGNAVIAATALVVLIGTIRGWKRRSSGNRFHWSGVAMLLFSTSYGSIETVWWPHGGLRAIMFTVSLVYLLCGIISKARGHWVEDKLERLTDMSK